MITILKTPDGDGCVMLTAAARATMPAELLAPFEVMGEFDPTGETIITISGTADINVMSKPAGEEN